MTITTTNDETLVLDEDDILIEFARIMQEWGHYRTAAGLRYPTRDEVRGTRTERSLRRRLDHG